MRKIKFLILITLILSISIPTFVACSNSNKNENATTYQIDCRLEENVLTGIEHVEFYNFTENA